MQRTGLRSLVLGSTLFLAAGVSYADVTISTVENTNYDTSTNGNITIAPAGQLTDASIKIDSDDAFVTIDANNTNGSAITQTNTGNAIRITNGSRSLIKIGENTTVASEDDVSIHYYSTAGLDHVLENSGTIKSKASTGVFAQSPVSIGNLAGGTIMGSDFAGVTLDHLAASLQNDGTVTGTAATAGVLCSSDFATIKNTDKGAITSDKVAISIGPMVTAGTVENAGMVQAGANFSALSLQGSLTTIENKDTGIMTATVASAGALSVDNDNVKVGTFKNRGIIENKSSGPAINLQNGKTGVLVHLLQEAGSMKGDVLLASDGGEVLTMTGGEITGSIITASTPTNPSIVKLKAGALAGSVIVNAEDTIEVGNNFAMGGKFHTKNDGEGTIVFQGNFQANQIGAPGAAFKTVQVAGPPGSVVAFNQDVFTTGSTILVNNGGTLFANSPVTLHGHVNVQHGVFSVGTPTVTVDGNLTLSNQSTLRVDFKNADPVNPYVHVTGAATISSSMTISAKNILGLPNTVKTITLVQADLPSSIGLPAAPPDTALLHFETDNPGNKLVLNVTSKLPPIILPPPLPPTPTPTPTPTPLPPLPPIVGTIISQNNPGGLLGDIRHALGNIVEFELLASGAAALSPLMDNSYVQESFASQTLYQEVIGERLWHYRMYRQGYMPAAGYASGDAYDSGGVWLKAYGNHGRQRGTDSNEDFFGGYRSRTFGVAVGSDATFCDDQGLLGVSFSFARAKIDHSVGSADTHLNSYQAALYGEWDECACYARWMVAYAHNRYHTDRSFTLDTLSVSGQDRFHGWQAGVYGEVGYDYRCDAWHINPAVAMYYAHLKLNGYTQTGFDNANQVVSGSSYNMVRPSIGLRLAYDIASGCQIWQPEVHGRILHNFKNDRVQATSFFAFDENTTMVTSGVIPKRTAYNLGASITCFGESPWVVTARYDSEIRRRYTAHFGSLFVRYAW